VNFNRSIFNIPFRNYGTVNVSTGDLELQQDSTNWGVYKLLDLKSKLYLGTDKQVGKGVDRVQHLRPGLFRDRHRMAHRRRDGTSSRRTPDGPGFAEHPQHADARGQRPRCPGFLDVSANLDWQDGSMSGSGLTTIRIARRW